MHKVTLRFAQDATDDDKKLFLDTLRDYAQDARLIEDEYADGPELHVDTPSPEAALERVGQVTRGVLKITRQPGAIIEASVGLGFM
jgi:hypothetical protein